MIDDKDLSESTLRLLASQALKEWSDKAVINVLTDDDYVVRTLAARELHMRSSNEVFAKIIELSHSTKPEVREICAFVLGQLGTPNMPFREQSVPDLLRLLTDDNENVRAASAAAIGHAFVSGMPISVEKALYHAAKDSESLVRCCVASALGSATNVKEAMKTLNILSKDADQQVREYALLGQDILRTKN